MCLEGGGVWVRGGGWWGLIPVALVGFVPLF